jgi:hypothetical protein
MDRKTLSKFLIALALFIYVAECIGSYNSWDETVWWYYMVLHFLGGFWVALFFIWFYNPKDLSYISVLKVMGSLFAVGILWEIYEFYVFNGIGKLPFDSFDTFADIVFNTAGGLFALFSFCKRRIVSKVN